MSIFIMVNKVWLFANVLFHPLRKFISIDQIYLFSKRNQNFIYVRY